jgi:hypothetical protein
MIAYSSYPVTMNKKALRLVREDIDLIEASHLARWEGCLVAQAYDDFQQYWPAMHPKY